MSGNRLAEPGTIGRLAIRNRMVMAPMISNLCDPDGLTNENHISYLEERAKGGAGLIITEYAYINSRNSKGSRNQMGFYNDDFTPKFRRLTERIHRQGAHVFAQLVHAGGKALYAEGGLRPFAPSAVDYMGTTPSEMSLDDIESVISDFVRAAKLARGSNFDGVELHGAHGYLIQEFLSPALNRREDGYGGSLQGRLRFAQEIVDAIRAEVDIALGIRLSLYEDDPDGYGPDYGISVAESLKSVDYVHFSAGRFAPPGSSISFYGNRTHIAARLPKKPAVKTIVVGSVTSAEDAAVVLEKADFVAVGRAMLADPFFSGKVIAGLVVPRPCIRCNQACRDITYGEVRCTVNPSTGLEAVRHPERKAAGKLDIAGAGVKGMEAAICAARAGLEVTIHDVRDDIGGQLLDITDEAKKREFGKLIDYYRQELKLLGVKIILGSRFSGSGLYCLPDRKYDPLPRGRSITVDTSIYQHHDEILAIAGETEITVSERSLRSLDRVRAMAYRKIAESKGVVFTGRSDLKFDVVMHEARQYDILAAMVSGREAAERYIERLGKGHT